MPLPSITALPAAPTRTMTNDLFVPAADAFLGALPGFRTDLQAFGDALVLAAASANYSATSTTSVAVGTGSKTFAIQAGKMFVVGQYVMAASAADSTKWVHGQVTAYNASTGSLTINVDLVGVAGTVADWSIGLSGPLPPTGWQTIQTVATTSGAAFDLTAIPTTYSDLMILFAGVSHNSGSSASLAISLGDGVTLSSGSAISNAMAASGSWRGSIQIPGYNEDEGYLNGGVEALSATPSLTTPLSPLRNWYVSGGIKAIRFTLSTGAGDAGSIILKGRK